MSKGKNMRKGVECFCSSWDLNWVADQHKLALAVFEPLGLFWLCGCWAVQSLPPGLWLSAVF